MSYAACGIYSAFTAVFSNVSSSEVSFVSSSASVCRHCGQFYYITDSVTNYASIWYQCRQISYVTDSTSVYPSLSISASPSLLFGFPITGFLIPKLPISNNGVSNSIYTTGVSISTPAAATLSVVSLASSMGILLRSSKVRTLSNWL